MTSIRSSSLEIVAGKRWRSGSDLSSLIYMMTMNIVKHSNAA